MNDFELKDVIVDNLYGLIKDNAPLVLTRITEWTTTTIPLISESANAPPITGCFAEHKKQNKWGSKTDPSTYTIMHDAGNILWIDKDETVYYYNTDLLIDSSLNLRAPYCFVSKNNTVYGIAYNHKNLAVYPNLDAVFWQI